MGIKWVGRSPQIKVLTSGSVFSRYPNLAVINFNTSYHFVVPYSTVHNSTPHYTPVQKDWNRKV